ncbi:MAG: antiterminator LoaP [Blautia sp.]|nr:antiterminator LoaP [Blautia sp.]
MYYVIYVGAGKEARAQNLIRQMVSKTSYEDCFYPIRHMNKKIHGTWTEVYERLLPGYLFLVSEDICSFYRELRAIPMFLNLLGREELDEQTDFYPLKEEEIRWLTSLLGNTGYQTSHTSGECVIERSQVDFDENDHVVILSGPLLGMEGRIRKLNLHKRYAEVELEFMNTVTVLHLGIEMIEKQN